MSNILEKRIFLIACTDAEKSRHIENWIKLHVHQAIVYTAIDGTAALAKIENVPPHVLFRALNFISHDGRSEFYLRFLEQGECLIREGDKSNLVYIVRKGRLCAFRTVGDKRVELGFIEVGEFVGEMAYIQNTPRVANVDAVTDCELIEVPAGTLDRILFRRPSWSKALMLSLSKRLGQANDALATQE